jgi:hypothetical protein
MTAKSKLRRRALALPSGISALTGQVCSEYVAKQVREHFSGNHSTVSFALSLLQTTWNPRSNPATKGGLLEYETLDQHTEAYETAIRARRKIRETAEASLSQSKPFHGNPFR